MFSNRLEAGEMLARKLKVYAGKNAVVLGIPRGGVPVAYVVSSMLHLPLDIVLTKKIGHPMNKEYAIGAVGLDDSYIIPHDDVSEEYIESAIQQVRSRLLEMQTIYKKGAPMTNITDKIVIIIDDGIATGNTLLVTVRMLRKSNPRKIVVAAPVSSEQAYANLSREADECICLKVPDFFKGVGAWYEDFSEVTDKDVTYYMNLSATYDGSGS